MTGRDFAEALARRGFGVFTGVPCSLIEDLIAALEAGAFGPYVPATREDAAVGLAGGAWLAGRRPAVLMQNSGLGTSLNALASFSLLYGLPTLLVVTWRGYQGRDAPEHLLTGAITRDLLALLGIPHRVLARGTVEADLGWAASEMDARRSPVALVLPPGVLESHAGAASGRHDPGAATEPAAAPGPPPPAPARGAADAGDALRPAVSRHRALAAVVKQLGAEPAIHANGYICRESFSVADRPQNFYMIGSMGLAAPIGLGLALARPTGPVVVLDGDGNLLMGLGALAMVASARPANFVHVVFDNEVYGSTGNQRSPSRDVRLDRLAAAAGYRTVVAATAAEEIGAAVGRALRTAGPHFVLAKVTAEEADVPRIPHSPHAIRDRFQQSLGTA